MGLCQILAIVLCPTEQKENRIHNGAEDNKERPYWPNSLCTHTSCRQNIMHKKCRHSIVNGFTVKKMVKSYAIEIVFKF